MRKQIEILDYRQLSELHRKYEDICTELNVGSDRARRDEVAAVIMDLAKTGERDAGALHQKAIIKLGNGRA